MIQFLSDPIYIRCPICFIYRVCFMLTLFSCILMTYGLDVCLLSLFLLILFILFDIILYCPVLSNLPWETCDIQCGLKIFSNKTNKTIESYEDASADHFGLLPKSLMKEWLKVLQDYELRKELTGSEYAVFYSTILYNSIQK